MYSYPAQQSEKRLLRLRSLRGARRTSLALSALMRLTGRLDESMGAHSINNICVVTVSTFLAGLNRPTTLFPLHRRLIGPGPSAVQGFARGDSIPIRGPSQAY